MRYANHSKRVLGYRSCVLLFAYSQHKRKVMDGVSRQQQGQISAFDSNNESLRERNDPQRIRAPRGTRRTGKSENSDQTTSGEPVPSGNGAQAAKSPVRDVNQTSESTVATPDSIRPDSAKPRPEPEAQDLIAVGTGGSKKSVAPPLAPIPGELILRTDYSSLPSGTPALSQAKQFREQLGPDVLYVKGFGAESQKLGAGSDEAEIEKQKGRERAGQINDASDQVRVNVKGNSLEVLYPKGGNTTSHSGLTYLQQIPGTPSTESPGEALDEIFINYQVKFEKDFPWQGGGKLPGVIASDGFRGKEDLSSIRLMWREDGRLEFYIHTPHEERTRLFWDNGEVGAHAAAPDGEWVDIQFRVKLNSVVDGVPIADGELEGWLNGEQVAFYDDVIIRGDESTNINSLFFSTFYGGSSGSGDLVWWPTEDSRAQFSDIQISKV